MATKNGNGKAATVEAPATAARSQIPKRIRRLINEAFAVNAGSGDAAWAESVAAEKKELLAYINGLLKNQKPAV